MEKKRALVNRMTAANIFLLGACLLLHVGGRMDLFSDYAVTSTHLEGSERERRRGRKAGIKKKSNEDIASLGYYSTTIYFSTSWTAMEYCLSSDGVLI